MRRVLRSGNILTVPENTKHQNAFSGPDAPLGRRRGGNRRIDRLTPGLRGLCGLGQRATVEFVLSCALRTDGLDLLEELAAEYLGRLNADLLAAAGADRFPPPPLRLVTGRRR
jgi:hypothetical protein